MCHNSATCSIANVLGGFQSERLDALDRFNRSHFEIAFDVESVKSAGTVHSQQTAALSLRNCDS